MTLKDLEIGQSAIIKRVNGEGALRQHFLDVGVVPKAEVTLVKYAPMGDPIELRIHGYELTLRLVDAEEIEIEEDSISNFKTHEEKKRILKPHEDDHPGLGEGGKYHDKKTEKPLDENKTLTFALMGNQNSGKTTLFNQLTGENLHVGNFPGITVTSKVGQIKGFSNTLVTDLPGVYSLSPYTPDEILTRDYILNDKPTGIINIVDATSIERNLYLTLQLMELGIPMVVALNMMDEVRNDGGYILVNEMEDKLGVPVIPISASKNEGIDELISHAVHVSKYQEKPMRNDFCLEDENGGAVHRCIHGIMELINDHAVESGIPVRFAATKLVEGDKLIEEKLNLTSNEKEMIEHIIIQMEEERGLDRAAAIADMRYEFIQNLAIETVIKPKESKEKIRTEKADRILTGKYTAIPCFIIIMALVFVLTFNVVGAWLQGLIRDGVGMLQVGVDRLLVNLNVSTWLHDLIIDGAIRGVGFVLSNLPIIVMLFFFLSMLEDSGYMARIAFVMDKLLRKIGLSGRSIVPLLIGFGCTVPAVMATRTLPSERDRKMTVLLTPFMSCTAKLPMYTFFIAAFFPNHGAIVMVSVYFLGIVIGILCALLFKKTIFKGEAIPFVMELPNYRKPVLKNVCHLLWDKTKDFVENAFTVIFLSSVIIWLLQAFDFRFNLVTTQSESMLAMLGNIVAPIFKPMGLGDWRIATALFTGIIAKESVVSTLSILFKDIEIGVVLTTPSAIALIVFALLYTPCVAAIASIKRELGGKNALLLALWQCALAWAVSLVIYYIVILII